MSRTVATRRGIRDRSTGDPGPISSSGWAETATQHATLVLVQACCRAVGYDPHEEITPDHPVVFYGISSLLSTILDSPDFFQR